MSLFNTNGNVEHLISGYLMLLSPKVPQCLQIFHNLVRRWEGRGYIKASFL